MANFQGENSKHFNMKNELMLIENRHELFSLVNTSTPFYVIIWSCQIVNWNFFFFNT